MIGCEMKAFWGTENLITTTPTTTTTTFVAIGDSFPDPKHAGSHDVTA